MYIKPQRGEIIIAMGFNPSDKLNKYINLVKVKLCVSIYTMGSIMSLLQSSYDRLF